MKVALASFAFVWFVFMTATIFDLRYRVSFVEAQAHICMDVLRTHEVLK